MTHEEWLQWRHEGIGSSDAPAVMNVSRFKTALQLYEEKSQPYKGDDGKNHWIKNRGHEIEPKIRSQFELLHGNVTWEPTMVQDANFPFLRATLDGFSPDKTEFVEIKLLGKEAFDVLSTGKVPEDYYPQVMHQWNVTSAKKAWFAGYLFDSENPKEYDPSRLKIIEVPFDEKYCYLLLETEIKFWNDNVMNHRPPAPSARDYKMLRGGTKLVNKWTRLKAKIDKLSEEQDLIRKEILEKAEADGHPRLVCAGISLVKVSTQGSVDNEKLYKDKGITEEELNKYRKGGRISWKFGVIKKETVQ